MEKIVVGEIETNCYIVPHENGKAFVIDPGGEAARIAARLDALSLLPCAILLTHGHLDHIAALPELVSIFEQRKIGLEIIIHKNDSMFLGEDSFSAHCATFAAATGGSDDFVRDIWQGMPCATRFMEEGDVIGRFSVIHLPGHTQGSVALYDAKNARVFSGDTLFRGTVGRTDLPESSAALLKKSLARILTLPGGTTVFSGHGGQTSIEDEKALFL